MSQRNEAGAAARWERQENEARQRRKTRKQIEREKREQEELDRAVQATPSPPDSMIRAVTNTPGLRLLYQNERVEPVTDALPRAQQQTEDVPGSAFTRWLSSRLNERLDREIMGTAFGNQPPKEDANLLQDRAKVARAAKLLEDTSQLLSRLVAGLEVTPDEAMALKARVDAGIQAFNS